MEIEQPLSKDISEELENLKQVVSEQLEAHDNGRRDVQEKLAEICGRTRTQVDGFENMINNELEEKCTAEESRLQAVLSNLQMNESLDNPEEASEAIQKAKAELLVVRSYELVEGSLGKPPKENNEGEDEQKQDF